VLNWNSWRQTLACLDSVVEQDYQKLTMIVLDNGSQDISWNALTEWTQAVSAKSWPAGTAGRVELLKSTVNLGFSGGCNLGIAKSLGLGADYVLLLNNDARLAASAISRLVTVAISRDAGIVGARVIDRSGKVAMSSTRWPLRLFWSGNNTTSIVDQDSWEVTEASGAAMLIREDLLRSRIEEFGHALDPSLFMYGEDTDLCVYARARGWRCVISRDAVVYHLGGGSSSGPGSCRSYYYITRNRVFLANRWLGLGLRTLFHLYFIPSRLALIAIRTITMRPACPHAVLSGLFDAYRSIKGEWVHHGAPLAQLK
jgi:GT2 family glycosyltransferase